MTPPLPPPYGMPDDRALPGHPHREGLDLVERDVLVVADAALGRAAAEVVLDAVAGEDLDGAVVHVDREVDGELAARLAEDRAQPRIEVEALGGEVELVLRDLPGVDRRAPPARWSWRGVPPAGAPVRGAAVFVRPGGAAMLPPPGRLPAAARDPLAAGRRGATEFTLGRSSGRPVPAA